MHQAGRLPDRMGEIMADSEPEDASDAPGNGRRKGDRRIEDKPIETEDRREGERRSGKDRRKEPRH